MCTVLSGCLLETVFFLATPPFALLLMVSLAAHSSHDSSVKSRDPSWVEKATHSSHSSAAVSSHWTAKSRTVYKYSHLIPVSDNSYGTGGTHGGPAAVNRSLGISGIPETLISTLPPSRSLRSFPPLHHAFGLVSSPVSIYQKNRPQKYTSTCVYYAHAMALTLTFDL